MNEEWEKLTNCEKLRYRICNLDVSENTSNKLFFEIANIEDEIFELQDRIDKAIEHLKIKQARLINEKDYVITDLDLDKIIQDLESKDEDNE